MPNRGSRSACGPIEGFVRPSLGFDVVKVSYMTTCPYVDNLEFDILVAGSPQCHFITSVIIVLGFERFRDFSFS